MKQLSMSMCVLALAGMVGCAGGTKDGEQAEKSNSAGTADEAVTWSAQKPVSKEAASEESTAGEAEHTFSLSVPFEKVVLTQGEEQVVRIGINRGENFGEVVEVNVTGLPKGVTMASDELKILQSSTGVELTLMAASDAALGDFTVKVIGQTTSSTKDYTKELEITVSPK